MLDSRAPLVVAVASALLAGCFNNVIPLEPKAESVKVVRESDRPLRCEVLGKISGQSRSSDLEEAKTGAQNDLRNQAAKLKGNFALVEAERHGAVGTSSQFDYFFGGKALLCQTEEMEAAADKAEAEAHAKKEAEDAAREQQAADEKKAAKDKGKKPSK